jgi:hypothetical protein
MENKYNAITDEEFQRRQRPKPGALPMDIQASDEPYTGVMPTDLRESPSQQSSWIGNLAAKHPDAVNKLGAYAKKVNNALPVDQIIGLGRGIDQGAENVGTSLENLLPTVNASPRDLSKGVSSDAASQLLFQGGKQVAPIAAFMAGEGALAAPMAASRGLLATGARGALVGSAIGQQEPGGRAGGAAAGALGSVLGSLPSKGIADFIVNRKSNLLSGYGKKYQDLFRSAEERGITKIEKPTTDFNLKSIKKAHPDAARHLDTVQEYLSNPTLENAHRAQSELNKLTKKVETGEGYLGHSLPASNVKGYDAALAARKAIKKDIYTTFEKSGRSDLSDQYRDISQGYAQDVVPYFDDLISKYEGKKITSKTLVKNLPNRLDFQKTASLHHQDLVRNALARSATKTALTKLLVPFLGTAAGGTVAGKYFLRNRGALGAEDNQ